ncbi:MAG: benzil reductase ((S)-benzoin forming) [Candidatus Krumholzibacteriia bacterium]
MEISVEVARNGDRMNSEISGKKLAVVTGTSSGIGAALAEALLAAGWTVVGVARRPVEIDNGAYFHFQCDLSDASALQNFATSVLQEWLIKEDWQRVGLVNNAALIGALKSIRALDAHDLTHLFAVNTVAPLYLMGFVSNLVPDQTPLRIANVSSGAATVGIPGLADYCASKAALRMAGMSLAAEIERPEWSGNTAVFSYEPGVVATQMQDVARQSDPAEFPSHEFFQGIYDQGLLLSAQDVVAELVEFLASDPAQKFNELRHGTN